MNENLTEKTERRIWKRYI